MVVADRHPASKGWHLNCSIKPDLKRLGRFKSQHEGKKNLADALAAADLSPVAGSSCRVGQQTGAVNDKKRLAFHADVARVAKGREEIENKALVALVGVLLAHQNFLVAAIPGSSPVFIRPTKAKGKIRLASGKQAVDRHVEKPAAVEPIIIEAKALNARCSSHGGLFLKHGGVVEIVEAEIGMRNLASARATRRS